MSLPSSDIHEEPIGSRADPDSGSLLGLISGISANAFLIIFLLLIFLCGIMIGGTALHDPDTCWLLATGRYIVEHGHVPDADPFSYTFAQLGRPWIVYQWLTEVCFYSAVRLGGLTALLALVSLVVVFSFVALPLRAFSRAGVFLPNALLVLSISILAASFHFLARPEIFSYLFGCIFLYVLAFHRLRLAAQSNPVSSSVDWKVACGLAFIMTLWVNFHTGFIAAFVVLSLYCVATLCARLVCRVNPLFDKTAWLGLLGCAGVSILNPFGVGLWRYIPELFFARFNPMIAELKPISSLGAAALPFVILVSMILFTWCRTFFPLARRSQDSDGKPNADMPALAVSLCITVVVTVEACRHQRIIPFSVLALIYEYLVLNSMGTAYLSAAGSQEHIRSVAKVFQERFSKGLIPGLELGGAPFSLFLLFLAIGGALLTALSIQKPVLPQSGKAFSAPLIALEKVASTCRDNPGNLLNDAQFGDCLIWYHPAEPKVFIDTRYDMYGEEFINEYLHLMAADEQFDPLMQKHKIRFVFARPDSLVIKNLASRGSSKILYSDQNSVFLELGESKVQKYQE